MKEYLTALVGHMGTRDACLALGYGEKSYSSLKSLCDAYGVTLEQRPNQHATSLTSRVSKPKIQRGIAVFDLHYPSHDKRLWNNILRFTEDFDPDVFLLGGDNLDCEPVSHWIGNKRRKVEGKRLAQDYAGYSRDMHAPLEEILSPGCRRIWHKGNHEDWVEQYLDEHPELEGFLEIERNIDLSAWEVMPYGATSQVGKCYFHHGEYVLQHHAAKTVQTYHRTIVYGHMHSFQAFTTVTPLDSDPHAGISIPCACRLNPHYSRDKPNAWVSGFCVFYVNSDNGQFNVYPVIAVDGAFTAPDGTRYI